jgi:hypothetical protein
VSWRECSRTGGCSSPVTPRPPRKQGPYWELPCTLASVAAAAQAPFPRDGRLRFCALRNNVPAGRVTVIAQVIPAQPPARPGAHPHSARRLPRLTARTLCALRSAPALRTRRATSSGSRTLRRSPRCAARATSRPRRTSRVRCTKLVGPSALPLRALSCAVILETGSGALPVIVEAHRVPVRCHC